MLTLALLRHAKSSWDNAGIDDFDRPLNARGIEAAPRMGAELARLGLAPGLILCSPAKRTRETLSFIRPHLAGKAAIDFNNDLYLAGAADLLRLIRDNQSTAQTVLLIGHNPGLHALAVGLAGRGSASDLTRLEERFPTAALAVFSFQQTSWHDIGPGLGGPGLGDPGLSQSGLGQLETFVTPRRLSD